MGGWCTVYVVARELCSVCASWRDPCLCSELHWCIPLHRPRDSYRLPALSLAVKVLAKSYVPRFVAVRLALTCLLVACASPVEGALRKACPSGNCHLVGFDLRTSCLCFPSGSLLRKVCPSEVLHVAFVTCSRANRCLLGFSECSRTFVWLLSPSGCDSFRAAGA